MSSTSLSLTNGSARVLTALCTNPGLVTDPVKLFRIGAFIETHLSDLPAPPKDADEATMKAWGQAPLQPIPTTEKTREALKEVVSAAIGKGMVGGHRDVVALMRALGLGDES